MAWFLKNKRCNLIIFLLLIPFIVSAQTINIENPLGDRTLQDVLNSIIAWIFTLSLAIAVIMYIIAGYRFITAVGDPQKIDTAKKMVLWASIGLGVVVASRGIIAIIEKIIKG